MTTLSDLQAIAAKIDADIATAVELLSTSSDTDAAGVEAVTADLTTSEATLAAAITAAQAAPAPPTPPNPPVGTIPPAPVIPAPGAPAGPTTS